MIASETGLAPLTLFLFGPMQVLVEGRPLPRLRSRKSLWLLALLALRAGRPLEREWLAGTLWPEVDQSRAATNLRVVLSELRRALGTEGERLQLPSRHTLSLELAGAEVDVLAFEAALARQDPEGWKQAAALYRGPLLEGCTEEWVPQERAVREQACLQALQALADAALGAEDNKTAADYYRRIVALDPWREEAQRGLMQALSEAGDTNAALNAYQAFVRLLRKDDPRAAPDEKTTTLYSRLRGAARRRTAPPAELIPDVPAAPVAAGYLPHSLTELIGREEEREEIAERLRRSRLVTLTGPGGIGKTRLALVAAADAAPGYPNGAWFAALEALSEGGQIAAQIMSVLRVKETAGRALLETITDHLRAKRLLLVLDNCEHLLEESAQIVGHLLRECAGVRILATSREALGIIGETAWTVPPLSVPDPAHLPAGLATQVRVLPGFESVRLFMERAQSAQKGFALTGENALAVARICARLEGIPLAIELAAARIKAMTAGQIAARLDDALGLLTAGSRAVQSRQQTLRATLDWSYSLLNNSERLLLQRLSVFVGGWTLDAAEAVCLDMASNAAQVQDSLASLVDKSLVTFDEDGRYRFLETVRQYAAEQLARNGQENSVQTKHRDWVLKIVEEAHLIKAPPVEEEISLRYLETEHENLRAALVWCEKDAQGAQAGLWLVSGLWRFWSERSHYSEGRLFLEGALARKGIQKATAQRGQALKGAGTLADHQGDYLTARALYEKSLAVFRELEQRQEIGSLLGTLHYLTIRHSDAMAAQAFYEQTREHYEQILILLAGTEDKRELARTHHFLGHLNYNQEDLASAQTHFEKALSISQELGDKNSVAHDFSCLFNVAQQQGDYASARALQTEALGIYQELGSKSGEALALNNLGLIDYNQGNYASARIYYEQSVEMMRELGDKKGVAYAFNQLSLLMLHQKNYAAAQTFQAERLFLCGEMGDRGGVMDGLERIAEVLLAQAEPHKAVLLWAAAHSLREDSSVPLPSRDQEKYARQLGQARVAMGEADFNAVWNEGRALTWEQMIDAALA